MHERIKALRVALGLNQTEFGARLGYRQTTVAGWESGGRSPNDAVVVSICREFGVSPEWLQFGVGEMFPARSREEEIAAFFGELSHDPDGSVRKALIAGLAQLDTDAWRAISDWITATFGIQSSPSPDEDAEK